MRWDILFTPNIFNFSEACAINLGSSVILTGGRFTLTTVSQYNEAGWEKDLPSLQAGRQDHGCAYFNNTAGSRVGNINIIYYPLIIFQTILVTGGYFGSYNSLSSTELLVGTASAWVFTGELPSLRWGLRGAEIDNKIFMTGNKNYDIFRNISVKY